MSYDEASEALDALIDEIIEGCTAIRASEMSKLGLDNRAGPVFVAKDHTFIATKSSPSINYYGGFEYIDPTLVQVVGSLTMYSAESSRVRDAIDTLIEHQQQEEPDDEE